MEKIHLGLYSDRAYEILDGVRAALKYAFYDGFIACGVRREDDGEVVLEKNEWSARKAGMSPRRLGNILEKYFNQTAVIFAGPAEPGENDPRASGRAMRCGAVRMAAREFFCIAEILKGRPAAKLAEKYGRETVDAIVGQPLDPFQVERKKILREEIADLDTEMQKKSSDVAAEYDRRREELEAWRSMEMDKLNRNYRERKTELTNALGAV